MSKLRTNVAVSVDLENPNITAIVQIELNTFIELPNGNYIGKIIHSKIENKSYVNDAGETINYEVEVAFYTKDKYFPKEQIDQLAQIANIDPSLLESEYREKLKEQALLIYVRNAFIDENNKKVLYNLLPEQWDLYFS